jgi:hypothetical protein
MTRKKTATAAPAEAGPSAELATAGPETFAQLWDGLEPGSRLSKGVYSIYKTLAGGLHIAYRPEGAGEDSHLPVPPAMVAMMVAASDGKGPLGRMRALVTGRLG